LGALAGLFLQVLKLCQGAGLVKLWHVALDGTKLKANASKHKAMSYGRMREKQRQLREEVRDLLAQAEAADAMAAGPDLLLGVLFIAAFAKIPTSDHSGG